MDELQTGLSEELNTGTSDDTELTLQQTDETSDNSELTQTPYWQQHDNYKKGFWKTEQDVLKGYDFLQKKYQPYETILGHRGINEPNELTEIFKKYDEYSDPESEINKSYVGLQNLVNHPVYGQKFAEFVNQIAEQEETQRYGMRLPADVKQQLQEVEQLKKWKEDQEQKAQQLEFNSELDNKISDIENFCKEKGIELGENDIKEYLNYCLDNNIGISQIYDHFVTKNLDKILGTVQAKTSKAITTNIQNNSKSAIAIGSRPSSSSTAIPSNAAELRKALQEQLGE